ncbi:hypothetical protein [Paenibacillus zanthoxyli]|uniref:hypothetical protein n=1 Tax=Paenibacillus zanthoxyli TaxID=369399 RepID=UPI00046F562E|nr:hypothetical protein [Paenibacillus zanthoxyli]
MKRLKSFIAISIVAATLIGGCSSDAKGNAVSSPLPTETAKTADFWTVIDGATWTGDFQGLKTSINKIVVSDKVPMTDGTIGSAVGVKFNIENTTEDTFTTYPEQAVLVTSTGEQVDAYFDVNQGTDIGGEIYPGVTKEGNVTFFLKHGHAEDIKWIRLMWNAHTGDERNVKQDNQKKYDAKIEFK